MKIAQYLFRSAWNWLRTLFARKSLGISDIPIRTVKMQQKLSCGCYPMLWCGPSGGIWMFCAHGKKEISRPVEPYTVILESTARGYDWSSMYD